MPTLTASLKQLSVTSQLPNRDAGYLQGVAIGFDCLKAVTHRESLTRQDLSPFSHP